LLVRSASSGKALTEQQLYACALRALTRRAHSIQEMRQYLERRAEATTAVSAVLRRLCEQNYLDDARYAVDFARQHANRRRQGRFRIARELRQRGVADGYINAALCQIFSETDETALVRARLKRQRAGGLDERKTQSLYRSLLRAGFSPDLIRSELRKAACADPCDPNGESLGQL
jgi:regulatory protein